MAPGDFHGSIRAYLGPGLTVSVVDDGYEVHAGGACVARLGNEWGSREVIARYEPALLSGGTIELAHGERLRLKPPALGAKTRVRRGRRETILAIEPYERSWDITFEPAARTFDRLPLLTMFAFHVARIDHSGGVVGTVSGP